MGTKVLGTIFFMILGFTFISTGFLAPLAFCCGHAITALWNADD